MARASSSRSAVTKLSPAFSAIFSALLEQPRGLRRQIELAGAGAFDLRQLAERRFGGAEGARGIAAGGADQIGRQAFAVVEQDLEQMLGCEPLMAAPLRQALRGLNEAARALGIFLDVHLFRPLSPRPISARRDDAMELAVLGWIWGGSSRGARAAAGAGRK